tara:strand:- start:190 stop:951 length:762 start_codon:yes stop_codon:yes gene_type:complete
MTSTIKADIVEAATGTNTDLTLQGKGTGVVNLSAGSKLNGTALTSTFQAASANIPDVAPSTSGNLLTSNGSAWTSATPAASGMGALLSSVSVSGSPSTVDFDGLFTSEYTYYKIIATGLRFSSGNDGLWLRFKSAATWQTATYTWQYSGIYNGGSALSNGSTSGTYIACSSRSGDNAAGDSMDFEITLGDPLGTTYYKNITCTSGGYYQSYPFWNSAWGTWRGGTGAVTGIRLYSNATTVSGGTVFLYGFKNT